MDDILIPVLCAVVVVIIIRLLINHYYSLHNKNLPPQADGGWPLIGHLRLLSGPALPHITLSAMADRFGPVFTLRLGVHRALIVSTPESAKECFTANDVAFSNRPKTAAIRNIGYDYAMFGFSPYGSYWRELRKVSALLLLSNNKVAALGATFETKARALARELHSQGKSPLELMRVLGDTSLDLMMRIVLGDDDCKGGGEAEKLREIIKEFFTMMEMRTLPDVFPCMKWLDLFGRANESSKRTGRKMDSVLQVWLEDRKRTRASSGLEGTDGGLMREMMAKAEKLAEEFPQYDADTINKATCQTIFIGGTNSMTETLAWALYLLLNNPHTMQIAQHELDTHVGRDRQAKVSDTKNLVYTQAIIKETLRLYPPARLSPPRESSEDCTVAGYHVPAGTHLMVNLWKLHRDPRVWDHPLEFRPERFVTGRNKEVDVAGQNFEFLPFGGGRRICPGVSFAMELSVFMLASLLHGFDIESASSNDEVVDTTGSIRATNLKDAPLDVVFKPRLSSEVYD